MNLSALPEDCIANIISLTTPGDACRLSLVSHSFKSAADSDTVWDRFLPSDTHDILSRSSSSTPLSFPSKKMLFLHLCDHPILIDDGKKTFSLDKRNGKKCYMIAPRDMTIIWGSSPEYWRWRSIPTSRFSEVAELKVVWWLEMRGTISTSMLSPNTNYAAYIVFKTREEENCRGFEDPVTVSVSVTGDVKHQKDACLGTHINRSMPCRHMRKDDWYEVELGEHFNERGDYDIEMELMQVDCSFVKRGIIIQGIEIRPKI